MSSPSASTPPFYFQLAISLSALAAILLVILGPSAFYLTPFREAQTAITAQYLAQGGPFFAYHTPVLGAPWSWPMEFPLFQWFAGLLSLTGIPLNAAGRLLSILSLAGCAMIVPNLVAEITGNKTRQGWAGILLLGSPLLLIYATGFLIESMALMASLAYAWLGFASLRWSLDDPRALVSRRSLILVLGSVICGILAATVKPTTWAPSAVLVGLVAAFWFFTGTKAWPGRLRHTMLSACILIIPLLIGLTWVRYSDQVKAEHPLAFSMVSAELASWNYGSLQQKTSPIVWGTIMVRSWILTLGPIGLLIPLYCGWGLWRARREPVRLMTAIALLAAYLSGPLVFTNLYFRHDYYSYANVGYLILALVVLGLGEELRRRSKWVAVALVGSMALTSFGYLTIKQRFRDPEMDHVIAVIKRIQDPGAVGLLGFDYSAAIPYATQRRALMVSMQEPNDRLRAAVAANATTPYAAVVALSEDFAPAARLMANSLGLGDTIPLSLSSGILIWTRTPLKWSDWPATAALQAYINERASAPATASGVVWLRLPFSSKKGNGFELIYRRGNEAVVLRSSDFALMRLRNVWTKQGQS